MLKNHVFGSFNLNNSEKHKLSFEDIFWEHYTKKMNPPSAVLGGGGGGARYGLLAHSLKALRIIANSHFIAHSEPLCKRLRVVKVIDMFEMIL